MHRDLAAAAVGPGPKALRPPESPHHRHPGRSESSSLAVALLPLRIWALWTWARQTSPARTSLVQIGLLSAQSFARGWQQIAARWHRTLQDQSGWLRGLGSHRLVHRVRILVSCKERSGPGEPPAAERPQFCGLVPQEKARAPKVNCAEARLLCHSGAAVLPSPYPCVDLLTRGLVRLR